MTRQQVATWFGHYLSHGQGLDTEGGSSQWV